MREPVLARVAELVGPIGSSHPLGGSAWWVETDDGAVVAKTGPGVGDEADGLRRLGAVESAPPVPAVVYADPELLVTVAVPSTARSLGHDESLGRSLAALHAHPHPSWGGGSSWIGACRVDPGQAQDGASFYARRLGGLAAQCGLGAVVERVTARLPDLLPPGGPALLHGDLWWGNVLAGADGRSWLIDPSVHGGHPEEDLAMLALFGPVPDRLLAAYREVTPLAAGWEERVALFQLYPLLVHTVLFDGGYRRQAESAARRYA